MIKSLQILTPILILISCTEKSQEKKSVFTGNIEKKPLLFNEVIPDQLPDSAKTAVIIDLVNEIETDTTLASKNYPDTSGNNVSAFYRNDTLVKIITGLYSESVFDTIAGVTNYNYYMYYFFMDTLICMRYECNSYQQTGMCNPVSASGKFYFCNRQIISQAHKNDIGQYGRCGCMDFSFKEKNERVLKFEKNILIEADRLKKLINHN